MTLEEARRKYTLLLKQHGIEEAEEEARVLLCYALNVDSAQLLAHPECRLTNIEAAYIDGLFQRRARGEPSAYIMQSRQFYGIDLQVGPGVLIPRPETEVLVEQAITFARRWAERHGPAISIADVGTGSGAIAVALALHLPASNVCAIDISGRALEIAQLNIRKHGLEKRVRLVRGDLLEKIKGKFDMIVANLPYVAVDEIGHLQVEIKGHEPLMALRGGASGVELIERLIAQSRACIKSGGALMLEIGAGQEGRLKAVAGHLWPGAAVSLAADLAGIDRVLKIEI